LRPLSLHCHRSATLSRIISSFDELSTSWGYVTCPLLTRLPLSRPLGLPLGSDSARLACVKHAASVHSEPGSNSSKCFFGSLFVFPKEEQGQRNDRDCLVLKDDPCRVENTPSVLLHPFSSLSSFQGASGDSVHPRREADGHPGGEAANFYSTRDGTRVKSSPFHSCLAETLFRLADPSRGTIRAILMLSSARPCYSPVVDVLLRSLCHEVPFGCSARHLSDSSFE
jgi:hypothetical protein